MLSVMLLSGGILLSPSIQAQETTAVPLPGDLDFLEVSNCRLYTTVIFEDGSPVIWSGSEMHTGMQAFSLALSSCKDVPKNFTAPKEPKFFFTIEDPDGNVVASSEKDISSDFRKLAFVSHFKANYSASVVVNCGGQYKVKAGLSPELFSYDKDIVLNEAAGVQVTDRTSRADSTLSPKVTITSGYPYDPEAIAGEHSLKWTVYAEKEPNVAIYSDTEAFELTSTSPLLAAVSEMNLSIGGLEPGDYIVELSSDYTPANRTFKARVNDVLRVEPSFDQDVYKAGVDKEAILKMDMHYGFPYIEPSGAENKPTVTVTKELLNETKNTEFSDEAWADAPMQYTADVTIPLQAVTQDIVDQYEGEVPLTVSVAFNGALQYKAIMIIPFEYKTSGIESIMPDSPTARKVKVFNLSGVEVDENYKGMVITSNGRRIVRQCTR